MTTEQAINKYSNTFTGQNPDILRTINEGKEIMKRLEAEGFETYGLWANPVSQYTGVRMIHTDDMLLDGFPADKPINICVRSGDHYHRVDQLQRWMDNGLWNWGLKFCLRWGWN